MDIAFFGHASNVCHTLSQLDIYPDFQVIRIPHNYNCLPSALEHLFKQIDKYSFGRKICSNYITNK